MVQGKTQSFSRKEKRRSISTSDELNRSLDDLLYGKSRQKKSRKRTKQQQDQALLQLKVEYFKMIDNEDLYTCTADDLPSFTQPVERTVRKRNLKDPKLLEEYKAYKDATDSFVEPISLEEFAASIRPLASDEIYEGYLED